MPAPWISSSVLVEAFFISAKSASAVFTLSASRAGRISSFLTVLFGDNSTGSAPRAGRIGFGTASGLSSYEIRSVGKPLASFRFEGASYGRTCSSEV